MSLGQGQEVVAENALDVAAENGHWVILQVRGRGRPCPWGEGSPGPPMEPPWAELLSWVLIRPVDVGRLPGLCASSALVIAGVSHRGQRGGRDKAGPQAGSGQDPGADRALAKRNHQDPQDQARSRGLACPRSGPTAWEKALIHAASAQLPRAPCKGWAFLPAASAGSD